MFLQILTHPGLREETRRGITHRMPFKLQGIVRRCFGLDLQDPSELQVKAPEESFGVGPGKFIVWELRGVLNLHGRNYLAAKNMITQSLVEIFQATEVRPGEKFSVRGLIPHVGTMSNVVEDLQPLIFEGV